MNGPLTLNIGMREAATVVKKIASDVDDDPLRGLLPSPSFGDVCQSSWSVDGYAFFHIIFPLGLTVSNTILHKHSDPLL